MEKESEPKGYQIIISELQKMLANGELKCGDKLPSERNMTTLFHLSRTSVREALRAMEMIGIVEKRHGEGNYIVNNAESSLTDVLSIMLILNDGALDEFMEFRKWIELGAVKSVIASSSEEEILSLDEKLSAYADSSSVHERTLKDIDFHKAIVWLSGNPFFISIFNAISALAVNHLETIIQRLTSDGKDSAKVDSIYQEHEMILNAIKKRDYTMAERFLDYHIQTFT